MTDKSERWAFVQLHGGIVTDVYVHGWGYVEFDWMDDHDDDTYYEWEVLTKTQNIMAMDIPPNKQLAMIKSLIERMEPE